MCDFSCGLSIFLTFRAEAVSIAPSSCLTMPPRYLASASMKMAPSFLGRFRSNVLLWLSETENRQWLLLCLPGLLIAILLRGLFWTHSPSAYFISDTRNFIDAAVQFADQFRLDLRSRTFLSPILYSIPYALHLPLMPSIALGQHILGALSILIVGSLARLWFQRWKLWIVPLTIIVAVHPTLLWYEHTALPESLYVFFVLLNALLATFYFRKPSLWRLVVVLASVFLTAGSRQEGFLFCLLPLLLIVRMHWGEWIVMAQRVGCVLLFIFLTSSASSTSQGGQMLLTSVIQFAPDKLWSEPDFSPTATKLRDQFKPKWPLYPAEHNGSRKIIVAAVSDYLIQHKGLSSSQAGNKNNSLCKKVAIEIAARNFWRLPWMAFMKFLATHREAPSPSFGASWVHDDHYYTLIGGGRGPARSKDWKYAQFYLGRSYNFDELEILREDVKKTYPVFEPDWLAGWQKFFLSVQFAAKLPDRVIQGQLLPGLPFLYPLALVGLIWLAYLRRPQLNEVQLWLLMIFFLSFIVFSTSSLRSRYRLVFEPWWFIGFFALLDSLVASVRSSLSTSKSTTESDA
jgi:hypothetical protein